MAGEARHRRKPAERELRRAAATASEFLGKEFQLHLTPQRFEEAQRRALSDGHVPLACRLRPGADEKPEETVLRLYVQSNVSTCLLAMEAAQRALEKELKDLPGWVDGASERVQGALLRRFRRGEIKASGLDRAFARRTAEKMVNAVLEPLRGHLRAAAEETIPPLARIGARGRAGRREELFLNCFGYQVINEVLVNRGDLDPSTWARCVGLLWVVSGMYPFAAGGKREPLECALRTASDRMEQHVEWARKDWKRKKGKQLRDAPNPGKPV